MMGKLNNIEISDEAERDFDNSYYFEESPIIANAFYQQINISFESVKKTPYSFPEV